MYLPKLAKNAAAHNTQHNCVQWTSSCFTSLRCLACFGKMFGSEVHMRHQRKPPFHSSVAGLISFFHIEMSTFIINSDWPLTLSSLFSQMMNRCQQCEGQQWTSFCSNLSSPWFGVGRIKETDRQTNRVIISYVCACLLHLALPPDWWIPLLVSLPCLKASWGV